MKSVIVISALLGQALAAPWNQNLKRSQGDCSKQPPGSGPVASPDTAADFRNLAVLSAAASNAVSPDGYSVVFTNNPNAVNGYNYKGYRVLSSYDTLTCASLCDQALDCVAFNVYAERDPTLDPGPACMNPPSTTNYKCALWGSPITIDQATNSGQIRPEFEVATIASNAYNKLSAPDPISGFNGPTQLGGAINAPLDDQGYNTFLTGKSFPGSSYNPQSCANACNQQTQYNMAHPNKDGSYQTCSFFTAYVQSKNGVPQGTYCGLYNETWPQSYGTNYGQYRGSDRYTISQSYSFSLALRR